MASGSQNRYAFSMTDKNREDAGHEYFSQLYGATSDEGEPQQTFFDKWRDKLLVNTYRKYGKNKLDESDVLDVGIDGYRLQQQSIGERTDGDCLVGCIDLQFGVDIEVDAEVFQERGIEVQ